MGMVDLNFGHRRNTMTTNPDPQGAADQRAHDEWMDGEGADCATTTGFWHAALAWERKRVAPPTPAGAEELAAALLRVIVEEIGGYEASHSALSGACAAVHARCVIEVARHFQPLREENATLRSAQKACEDCMTPTYAALREELARVKAELAKELEHPRSFFDKMNQINQWYGELVDVIYGEVPDGINDRPNPIDFVRGIQKDLDALRTENAALRTDLEQMTSDRNGVMAINEQHRKALTAAEARCKELEAALHSIARAPTFDINTQTIVDLARNTLTAARKRKD